LIVLAGDMSLILVFIVAGLETGSLYALMALGLVLIYKTQTIGFTT
jgi:branched-subunit amino acid ABC-type transport system permease component